MTVQADYQLPSTTQQKEWHYIYFRCKKVRKAPHIISHSKNDTMSPKNHLTNYLLAIKDVLGLFHVFVSISLFTKSGDSALSRWLTLTCTYMSITDGWLKSICVYSYAQSHVLFLVLMVCMLLSVFSLL